MPLNINLPTDRQDGSPGHTEGHNAANAALNMVGAAVDGIEVRTSKLARGVVDPTTIPYAPSIIVDATQGPLFRVVATGDLSIADIVEAAHGQTVTVRVYASGGARSVTAFGRTDPVQAGTWWAGRFTFDQFTNTWGRDNTTAAATAGAPGVSDHGALTGLADDDHPHYLTVARGDARYYTEVEVDAALAGKAAAGHTHEGAGGLDPSPVPLTANGGTITPDADAGLLFRHDATADVTLADPTGGIDGQTVDVQVWAVGADRTLTVRGAATLVPSGTARWVRFSRDAAKGQWILDTGGSGGGGGVGSESPTFTGTARAPRFVGAAATVPYAASITLNSAQATTFRVTATGNFTLADITGGVDNQTIALEVLASGGDRTISFGGGALSAATIPAGQRWMREFRFHAADNEWRVLPTGGGGGATGGSGGVPDDGSVTNAKVAANAAISLDKTADSASRLAMTAAEKTKLGGIATIASTGSASDLTSGTVAPPRLGSGTASAATVLYGDNVWRAAPTGGSGGVPDDGSVTNVKVAANAAISLDKTADSGSRVAMTAAERAKLDTLNPGGVVSGTIPSGSTTPTVTHSLGSSDLLWSVREVATGAYPSSVTMTRIDDNSVRFTFSVAPAANQYRYTIAAASAILAAPQVRDVPVAAAYAASLTLNATAGNLREVIATGNLTLNEPASGANGQVIGVDVFASGGQRVVTFAAGLKRPPSIASTLTIPAGQWGTILLKHRSSYGWTVGTAFAA